MMLLSSETIAGRRFEVRMHHGGSISRTVDGERVHSHAVFQRHRIEAEQEAARQMPPNWLALCKESLRCSDT